MVEVSIDNTLAVFTIKGLDQLWAMKREIRVPLNHIVSIREDASPSIGWFDGFKIAGSSFPNRFRAGTFYQNGGKVFWDVRQGDKVLVVDLKDEGYRKLIVAVDSPGSTIRMIKDATERRKRLFGAGATER
jgi:hypothetical protein